MTLKSFKVVRAKRLPQFNPVLVKV
uniref:Uncharacterized protein n=1 Tax=Rhizophora mucronata TaxID=61149 RepID=A0A2P2QPC7_RHIMU